MKIAVLMGGTSAERNVSLSTGRAISAALEASGHEVLAIDTADGRLLSASEISGALAAGVGSTPPQPRDGASSSQALTRTFRELPAARDTQVIFIALHGGAGEDGRLQALLDFIGIPYTGSDYLGSALAMDKLVSKQLFSSANIPTPEWLVGQVDPTQVERELGGFPVVVKPSREGSTVGVSVVTTPEGLSGAVERASRFEGPPLVERFVPGRELAVGVLGDEALPIVEIRPSHQIYDYECKYTPGMSQYEVPAPLGAACTAEVQTLALQAHRVLRLDGYSRIDFRLDDQERPWCLEANSLPGMTATSLLPKAAAAAGLSFERLCQRLVDLSLQRWNERRNPPAPGGLGK